MLRSLPAGGCFGAHDLAAVVQETDLRGPFSCDFEQQPRTTGCVVSEEARRAIALPAEEHAALAAIALAQALQLCDFLRSFRHGVCPLPGIEVGGAVRIVVDGEPAPAAFAFLVVRDLHDLILLVAIE